MSGCFFAFSQKTLAFFALICYYLSAIRTGADSPHVAVGQPEQSVNPVSLIGQGTERSACFGLVLNGLAERMKLPED